MAEPRARAGDSRQPLCRQTTAVTWSRAACAPTTRALCTACARCKPGEPEMEGGAREGAGRGRGGAPRPPPRLLSWVEGGVPRWKGSSCFPVMDGPAGSAEAS